MLIIFINVKILNYFHVQNIMNYVFKNIYIYISIYKIKQKVEELNKNKRNELMD